MANLNSPQNQGFALRDYHHAAKTFTQEPGYTKTPYTGFNFHVNISFNNLLGKLRGIETKDISVLVRAANLPETQFETETLNQYNRKRVVNKRVVYQPIKLEFHDDIANNIRNMWIAYNQHYNADSNYTMGSTWTIDDVYANYSLNRKYGLDNGNSLPFINKIEIYSMGNGEYSKMLLVNPLINSAQFDDHEYSESAKTMSMQITVDYENIIYSAGTTDQISGFGKNNAENYDQNESLLEAKNLSSFPTVSNVSINQNPGANVQSNLNNGRPVVADTTIEPAALSDRQLAGRQIDPVTGNVSHEFRNNNTPATVEQYNQNKNKVQNTTPTGFYTFPDASNNSSIGNGQTQVSGVSSGINVSSNNENISSSNLQNNTGTVPGQFAGALPSAATSGQEKIAENFSNPKIPAGLTPAEQQLFINSFPSLPSTDPRASKPPYV